MTEKLRIHDFRPQKMNRWRCEDCEYLANNPIHRRSNGQMIRGTAHPDKLG
jgi:hypothetical protein